MATNTRAYIIGCRNQTNGQLVGLTPENEYYTLIAVVINMAQSILAQNKAIDAMGELAYQYDVTRNQGNRFRWSQARAREYALWFARKLHHGFPPVVLDYSWSHPDCLAMHPRLAWSGPEFPLRTQGVHLNGTTVNKMVGAARRNEYRKVQRFLFQLAMTVVHEAGAHMLITSLGRGRADTPPNLAARGFEGEFDERGRRIGESGRWFERWVFGGTMHYIRDFNEDNNQPGIPYLFDDADVAWPVDPRYIDQLCRGQASLPVIRGGRAQPARALRSIGAYLGGTVPNGRHTMSRPAVRPEEYGRLRGFRVEKTRIARVPQDLSIRLRAVRAH